ncbi:MAG: hypothetical protein KGZ39_05265 [Simkania sp.]|nr:hypothetical protein [Simkania sp.]
MQHSFLVKFGICLLALSAVLYQNIEEQNQITAFKIALPKATKKLKVLREESMRLRYEIEQFESPEHLLELARMSEYSHLKHPLTKEILTMHGGVPLLQDEFIPSDQRKTTRSITVASHAPLQP